MKNIVAEKGVPSTKKGSDREKTCLLLRKKGKKETSASSNQVYVLRYPRLTSPRLSSGSIWRAGRRTPANVETQLLSHFFSSDSFPICRRLAVAQYGLTERHNAALEGTPFSTTISQKVKILRNCQTRTTPRTNDDSAGSLRCRG